MPLSYAGPLGPAGPEKRRVFNAVLVVQAVPSKIDHIETYKAAGIRAVSDIRAKAVSILRWRHVSPSDISSRASRSAQEAKKKHHAMLRTISGQRLSARAMKPSMSASHLRCMGAALAPHPCRRAADAQRHRRFGRREAFCLSHTLNSWTGRTSRTRKAPCFQRGPSGPSGPSAYQRR